MPTTDTSETALETLIVAALTGQRLEDPANDEAGPKLRKYVPFWASSGS